MGLLASCSRIFPALGGSHIVNAANGFTRTISIRQKEGAFE